MARRLPPLTALRAFEAGARHLSFTKAAQDLNVSQAAISHQVKALEEHLGVRLFRRFTRKLVLTDEGRRLYPVLSEAFERIADTVQEITDKKADWLLTVSLLPSFGARWLVGRLGRFRQSHPEIDLRLHHSLDRVDFARDDVDMAVRWGRGDWPGLAVDFLKGDTLIPVCSPDLLEAEPPLRAPADLAGHTLLHEEDYDDWTQWLRAAGAPEVESRRGPVMDDPAVIIQAALGGQGVALVTQAFVADDLAAGRLVRLFELSLETEFAYYIVYPADALEQSKVRAFRDFLLAEAAAEGEREPVSESARSAPV